MILGSTCHCHYYCLQAKSKNKFFKVNDNNYGSMSPCLVAGCDTLNGLTYFIVIFILSPELFLINKYRLKQRVNGLLVSVWSFQ